MKFFLILYSLFPLPFRLRQGEHSLKNAENYHPVIFDGGCTQKEDKGGKSRFKDMEPWIGFMIPEEGKFFVVSAIV